MDLLQLSNHVVQNCQTGKQMTHWDLLNKANKFEFSLFNMSEYIICSPVWRFCTTWLLSCKRPIASYAVVFYDINIFHHKNNFQFHQNTFTFTSIIQPNNHFSVLPFPIFGNLYVKLSSLIWTMKLLKLIFLSWHTSDNIHLCNSIYLHCTLCRDLRQSKCDKLQKHSSSGLYRKDLGVPISANQNLNLHFFLIGLAFWLRHYHQS